MLLSQRMKDGVLRGLLTSGRWRNLWGFIEKFEVLDVVAVGRDFSWFSLDGAARSRLDRFLLLKGLLDLWKVDNQVIRLISLFGLRGTIIIGVLSPSKFSIVGLNMLNSYPLLKRLDLQFRMVGRLFILSRRC